MPSSMASERWAVVRAVSPPPIGPSSRTTTFFPSRARWYATESPAIPAPMTHTSVLPLFVSFGNSGSSTVSCQIDVVLPPGCGLACAPLLVAIAVLLVMRDPQTPTARFEPPSRAHARAHSSLVAGRGPESLLWPMLPRRALG